MFDVTWEAPDGSITPLDGHLDEYFQEVYLDAASIPIFSKLAKHVSEDALDDYCDALEKEVHHYLGDPNYGKAARRMYNLFRMNGRYAEAAYIRELFDEPASMLYQVWSLIRTMEEADRPRLAHGRRRPRWTRPTSSCSASSAPSTAARSPRSSRRSWRSARACRTTPPGEGWTEEVEGARTRVINLVNSFFHERLMGLDSIADYMAEVAAPGDAASH